MMTNKEATLVSFEQSGHIAFECDPTSHDDDGMSCMFCSGGLFACTRCGSFEGMTTTHCPGDDQAVKGDIGDAVYNGQLDYRAGEWVAAGSPHTPNRGWQFEREWFK